MPTTANGGITDGGKTVTVHIQPNVKFSPPVNRVVTSADVAYAIERGANPNVANPYFAVLRRHRRGRAEPPRAGRSRASRRRTRTTIVFHLTKPRPTSS